MTDLDRAIAEVKGIAPVPGYDGAVWGGPPGVSLASSELCWSTDLSRAWELVEELRWVGFGVVIEAHRDTSRPGQWIVTVEAGQPRSRAEGRAENPAEAICRAYLAARGQ